LLNIVNCELNFTIPSDILATLCERFEARYRLCDNGFFCKYLWTPLFPFILLCYCLIWANKWWWRWWYRSGGNAERRWRSDKGKTNWIVCS